ncbi:MAG: MATE family efflux transporter, partial [Bacteroidia bacterium]|nr:MATE family efflux transporter [Bacteroidia bacterium]
MGTVIIISSLTAYDIGGGRILRTGLWLKNNLIAAFILFLICGTIILVVGELLPYLGQDPVVSELCKPYLRVITLSLFPMLVFIAAKSFCDGFSVVMPTVWINLIGLVFNVLMNWLLIYGKGPFPALGLLGAGYATLSSRILMAGLVVALIVWHPAFKQTILDFRFFRWNAPLLKIIFQLGMPGGFQYLFEVGAFSGAALLIGKMGAAALAAHQVAINLASVTYMMAYGLGQAGSVRVATHFGGDNLYQARKSGFLALFLVVVLMTIAGLSFVLFREQFVLAYHLTDPEAFQMAVALLLIAALFQLFDGIQATSLCLLRGIQDVNIPMALTLVSYWGIALPTGYYLGIRQNLGTVGVWYGLMVGLIFAAITLTFRFFWLTNTWK